MKNQNTILVVSNNPTLSIEDALKQFEFVDPEAPLDKTYADLEESSDTILNELADNFEGLDWAYKLLDGDSLTKEDEDSIKAFKEAVEQNKDAYNVQLEGTGIKGDPYRYILSLPADKPLTALKLYRWENPEGFFTSVDIQGSVALDKKSLNPSVLVIANPNGESRLYAKSMESLSDDKWSSFVEEKINSLGTGSVRAYQGVVQY